MTVRCSEIMDPLSFVQKESPLKSGYESSGDPRGRLTNRFHIGGRGGLDRIGAAYSSDPITRWQTH